MSGGGSTARMVSPQVSPRARMARRRDWRRGISLVELLVALTLLGVSGSYAIRLFVQAAREMEGAELGLRAALFLSELRAGGGGERPAGPGRLIGEVSGEGARVRYEPPGDGSGGGSDDSPGGSEGGSAAGSGGFLRPQSWTLALDAGS